VTIDLATEDEPADKFVGSVLLDLLGDDDVELADGGRCELPLSGYDYRWLRVLHAEDRRLP
jgi:hypothetical protein